MLAGCRYCIEETGMDWEVLIERLWAIIEARGFAAFKNRLSAVLPDQSFAVLIQTIHCLLATGQASLAHALLGDFLKSHVHSAQLRRRMMMVLLFETRYETGNSVLPVDFETLLSDVHRHLEAGRQDEARRLVIEALKTAQDPQLFELLGRISVISQLDSDKDTLSGPDASAVLSDHHTSAEEEKTVPAGTKDTSEEYDFFVWEEASAATGTVHDHECLRAAEQLQYSISKAISRTENVIDWFVEPDDQEQTEPVLATLPEATGMNHVEDELSDTAFLQHEYSSEKAILDYFNDRYADLRSAEKRVLDVIFRNPGNDIEYLAAALQLHVPVLKSMLARRLRYWLEKGPQGSLAIRASLTGLLPSDAFREGSTRQPEISAQETCTPPVDPQAASSVLQHANRVLLFFNENPGQKIHAAAGQLDLPHAVILELLDGPLADVLECNDQLVVQPASHSMQSPPTGKHPIQDLPEIHILPDLKTQQTSIQADDITVTDADIMKAARLTRLPASSRKVLGLLHREGHARSRDLASLLEVDVDLVNRALLGPLSDYVTVRHSVWRLDDRIVPALRFAGII